MWRGGFERNWWARDGWERRVVSSSSSSCSCSFASFGGGCEVVVVLVSGAGPGVVAGWAGDVG